MYGNAAKTYQQANYFTASPLKLVLMCYDGAISSLKLARGAYREKNFEAKGRALQKAIDIIHELNASLDMNRGGGVAANLRALYLFMIRALTEADLQRDIGVFDEVIRMLEELESAWKQIAVTSNRSADAGPVSTRMPAFDQAESTEGNRAWNV